MPSILPQCSHLCWRGFDDAWAGPVHLGQFRPSAVAGIPAAEHVCGSSAICTSAGEALYAAPEPQTCSAVGMPAAVLDLR